MAKQVDVDELKRRARERKVKRAILTIFPPHKPGFGKQPSLTHLKTESKASTWIYKTVFPDRGEVTLFVKANEAGESPLAFRTQTEEARRVSALHSFCSPTHYGIYTILSDSDILPGYSHRDDELKASMVQEDLRLLKAGLVRNYELHSDSIVIEMIEYIPGLNLGEKFEQLKHKKSLSSEDCTFLDKLCETFHGIHRVPTDNELYLSVSPEQNEKKRMNIYNESLEKVLDRASTYLPIEEDHPLLSKSERVHIFSSGSLLRKKLWGKVSNLRLTHGDAQARNCNEHSRTKKIFVVDWGRINVGHFAIDWGRFLGDLLWRYSMDHSRNRTDYLLQVTDYLIRKCEELYEHKEFRTDVCFGLYSIASIRLSKRELLGIDLNRARQFYTLVAPCLEKNFLHV